MIAWRSPQHRDPTGAAVLVWRGACGGPPGSALVGRRHSHRVARGPGSGHVSCAVSGVRAPSRRFPVYSIRVARLPFSTTPLERAPFSTRPRDAPRLPPGPSACACAWHRRGSARQTRRLCVSWARQRHHVPDSPSAVVPPVLTTVLRPSLLPTVHRRHSLVSLVKIAKSTFGTSRRSWSTGPCPWRAPPPPPC